MVKVDCTPRDRVYGVELSTLKLNLIEGFMELFHTIIRQLMLSYGIRV